MFDVIFYKTKSGDMPVQEYIIELPQKLKTKTLNNINRLREEGLNARRPLSGYLRDGIFELRTQIGTNLTRLLYFFSNNKAIVFTNGFTKKTEEVPESEIRIAKRRKLEYESGAQNG